MSSDKEINLLLQAYIKAANNSFFLASDLENFKFRRGIEVAELGNYLGCLPEMILKLGLCRRPEPESPSFRADIQRIANTFELESSNLLQLLREVDALRAFEDVGLADQQQNFEGLLMAARDADVGDTEDADPEAEISPDGDEPD